MESSLIIFWIIVSFTICMIRSYGLLNPEDNLMGKNKSEKRKNLFFFFTKIWFSTLPVLLTFWIFFFKLDQVLLITGIDLAEYKVLKSLLILVIGIPMILISGYLGNKLWMLIFSRYIDPNELNKFSFWEKEIDL
ncbi:MAG: hypothetical protein C4539_17060 [Ignavibacteriales bacterium]|nr:MAG: hypothetical protein C4539_17060 [Ignavibacteriales bacterium]